MKSSLLENVNFQKSSKCQQFSQIIHLYFKISIFSLKLGKNFPAEYNKTISQKAPQESVASTIIPKGPKLGSVCLSAGYEIKARPARKDDTAKLGKGVEGFTLTTPLRLKTCPSKFLKVCQCFHG